LTLADRNDSETSRKRVDVLLVERGLFESRARARAAIEAGGVTADGKPVAKASDLIAADATLAAQPAHPYVSRGGVKLAGALEQYPIEIEDHVCLDVGASTGGFTDLLLRRGASKVYAIDVGYGQLAWSLRQDPRVVVLERENVRELDPARVPEPCDLAVIDVSFISLTLVLPRVRELLRPPAGKSVIALVKPQFEAGREQVGKGGVVRDPAARQGAIDKVAAWAAAHGFTIGATVESPIHGPAGNIETLLHLRTADVTAA
jgi:23S rRNA (cytidine1920-2'-O)/16S rRNA (cytidine1409-2'-O)-methyltransferase